MIDAPSTSAGGSRRLWETLRLLPKIDLHRHLEGSLRLSTLAEVAQAHGVDLPSYNIEDLRPYVQVTDEEPNFHAFLEKFRFLRQFYSTREAIERVAYEAVADAAADNVRYLELRFSPATLAAHQGFDLEEVTDWVIWAVEQAGRDFGVTTGLLVTIKRELSPSEAERVARVAFARAGRGIVGLDIAGDEVNYPLAPFAGILRQAHREGLGLTIHAGEAIGAWSVREAVEEYGADRIGHGVRAVEDPEVVELLCRAGVTLEICPTSNIHTATVPHLARHPLRHFLAQGVRVTINTDDPSISNTTLTDEYLIAVREIGVSLPQLGVVVWNGVRAAFTNQNAKEQLWRTFKGEWEKILAISLPDALEVERPR
ncbi:MAG: adenosine deaminase [Anaerolineae bacterium]|nr:adenosine deaminase [Anaerolineae bacterium]